MAPEPENTIFLQGRTWVGPDKQIISFVASGELAHSRQNQEIRKLVQSHPEWSEEQAIHALKEAGARYGPAEKARFTQSLDLERAQDSLGRLRIVSVEFVPLQQERVGSFSSGALQWVVHAEGETADKTRITYILWFEPFEGKLVHIYRKGAPVG